MNIDRNKRDTDGKLKNGLVKEHYKNGCPASVGKYRHGENVGEWRAYDAKGKLVRTTRHSLKQTKSQAQ